jgi:hypothetical protein
MIVCLRTVAVPAEKRADYLAWIATPARDQLTASEIHQAVEYRPITRYDVAGGYVNLTGLARHDPINPTQEDLT